MTLEELILLGYLGVFSTILVAVLAIFFLWFYFKRLKKPAKILNNIINQKKAMLFLASDAGTVDIKEVKEIAKGGVLKGAKDEYYLIPTAVPIEDESKMSTEERLLREIISKRSTLKHTGCPVFFGYSGMVTVLPPDALALYETSQAVQNNPQPSSAMSKAKTLLLNPRKIREILESSYSHAQLITVIRDVEDLIRAEFSGRKVGTSILWILLAFIIFAVVLKMLGIV